METTTLRKMLLADPRAASAFEFHAWSHYRGGMPTIGEDNSYGGLSSPMGIEHATLAMIPLTCGSDYVGGAVIAELSRWTPGCGFSPMNSTHLTAANARAVGEEWLTEVTRKHGMVKQ